jgi:hypothetical protein
MKGFDAAEKQYEWANECPEKEPNVCWQCDMKEEHFDIHTGTEFECGITHQLLYFNNEECLIPRVEPKD